MLIATFKSPSQWIKKLYSLPLNCLSWVGLGKDMYIKPFLAHISYGFQNKINKTNDILFYILHVCFFNAWEKSRTTVNYLISLIEICIWILRAKTAINLIVKSLKKKKAISPGSFLTQIFFEEGGFINCNPCWFLRERERERERECFIASRLSETSVRPHSYCLNKQHLPPLLVGVPGRSASVTVARDPMSLECLPTESQTFNKSVLFGDQD